MVPTCYSKNRVLLETERNFYWSIGDDAAYARIRPLAIA
jgi:hypothetical protein